LFGDDASRFFGKAGGIGDVEVLCAAAPIEIGNRVWKDLDGDGIQDGDEAPIVGVTVRLYDDSDTLIAVSITNAQGEYYFSSAPGVNMAHAKYGLPIAPNSDYTIRLDNPSNYDLGAPLDGLSLTPADANANADDMRDSDATTVGGFPRISYTTGAAGANDHTLDFGFSRGLSLGNLVWDDLNNNGLVDAGEPGIQGVRVQLFDANGAEVNVGPDGILGTADDAPGGMLTNATGNYLFDNLPGGDYVVKLPASNFAAGPLLGYVSSTGAVDTLELAPELGPYETAPDPDNDTNNDDNGTRDTISGDIVSAVVTLAAGDEPVNDEDTKNSSNLSVDFGVFKRVSVGDFAWYDDNTFNGAQDAPEATVPGVKVDLYSLGPNGTAENGGGDDVLLKSTYTDGLGRYLFDYLPRGQYYIRFSNLPGTFTTTNTNLVADDIDSDAGTSPGPGLGFTAPFTLTDTHTPQPPVPVNPNGAGDPTWDVGVVTAAGIGDFVWLDDDRDGVQDPGETGIPGVTVELLRNGVVISTTTTNPGGAYVFDGITPSPTGAADYAIRVVPPSGYIISPKGPDGSSDPTDSDINPLTGETETTELTPGEFDPDWDAGLYRKLAIGDTVWFDNGATPGHTNNGVLDGDESGIDGVTVELFLDADQNGVPDSTTPISSTTTASGGKYLFTNLDPGHYIIGIPPGQAPLADKMSSTGNGAAPDPDDNVNNDDNGDLASGPVVASFPGYILAQTVTLNSDKEPIDDSDTNINTNLSVDFGFIQWAAIGDVVWHDLDADGVQDGSEPGIQGVTVTLYNENGDPAVDLSGNPVTATTTITGYYHFTNLIPGVYSVGFSQPSGFVPTAADAGLDDTKDSDANPATLRTVPTYLAPGEDDLTWDAGFYRPASIGNQVWFDLNGNGVQDGGAENGVDGVKVTLYSGSGAVISDTVTTGGGLYNFPNLRPGDYYLVFDPATLPPAHVLTITGTGTLATDSDANPTTDTTAVTTLEDNENDPTWDAGVVPAYSLGNRVWYDTNNDGQDNDSLSGAPGSSTGINDVIVQLYAADGAGNPTGAALQTQVTSNGGYYLFTGLRPGDYVVVLPESNFSSALQGLLSSGTTADATGAVSEAAAAPADSDTDRVDDGAKAVSGTFAGAVVSSKVTLGGATSEPSGEEPSGTPGYTDVTLDTRSNLTVDFGFYGMKLGNLVFHDVNNNGVFDSGTDSPLAGATVRLYAADGTTEIPVGPDGILGTADDAAGGVTTDATGAYLFAGLAQGDYVVKVTPSAGYNSSADIGSSATPNSADNDDNGQGAGQGQVGSATVTLTPGSMAGAPANVIDHTTGTTTGPAVDFGFYTLSLGNLVWNDVNNNGAVDGVEAGINGVLVNLFVDTNDNGALDAGDTQVLTQTTTNAGHYLFTGLAPGKYLVQVDPSNFQTGGALEGYRSSTGANGAATGPNEPRSSLGVTDNDDNGTTGSGGLATAGVTGGIASNVVTLAAGGAPVGETDLGMPTGVTDPAANANSNLSIDFGVFRPASLGDYVWIDTDKDGAQEAGENGVNGVQVSLYTANGADGIPGNADDSLPIATTITGDNPATGATEQGFYSFGGLAPNTDYTVKLDRAADFTAGGPLAGYNLTTANAGVDDTQDSDAALVAGIPTISATTGAPGSDTPTFDFGFNTSASLGDYVWLDPDNDGVQDAGEVGINGVTVRLYDGATLIATTVTTTTGGIDGYYSFGNLDINKVYTVKLDNPADYAPGGPLNGLILAPQNAGSDFTKDSDAALVSSFAEITTATTGGPGSNTPTYDIGFHKPVASLGDEVWFDADKDGVQDAGETGINGVTVNLYSATGPDGIPETGDENVPIATDVTETNGATVGYYTFANLNPNTTYTVRLDNPLDYAAGGPLEFYRLSPANQGGDDINDSDAILVGGYPTISAAATGADLTDTPTYDFGLYQPLSLGSLVWHDINNNGVKDAGETGVDGVLVNLFVDSDGSGTLTPADTQVLTQTTSNGGHYRFTDLGAGGYFVQIAPSNFAADGPLDGYSSSTGQYGPATGPYEPGATTPVDNDDNGSGADGGIVSGLMNLAAGGAPTNEPDTTLPTGITDPAIDANSNLTVDFGVFKPASVGSYVWNDTNKDGMKDPEEIGVAGVTVTLYDESGTPIATTTTGPNGEWQFTNLAPGSYRVGFSNLPSGYEFTSPNSGNDANDSDADPTNGLTPVVVLAEGENNPTLYAGIVRANPTAVTLTRFTATWDGAAVRLEWATGAEVDTLGFHVYRSASGKRADAERVTPNLIQARGRGQGGAEYGWTDTDVEAGTTYTYWLEEVEVGGEMNEYGPVTASAQPDAARGVRVFLPVLIN
jgi:hypothetical protein